METDSKPTGKTEWLHVPGIFSRTARFILHFLEMCVLMCFGAVFLAVVLSLIGTPFGYPRPSRQLPGISSIILAIFLSLLMIAWMRLRGHEWQPSLEMASTNLVIIPLLVSAYLGVIEKSRLYSLECVLACVLMLIPMLIRFDMYSGHHGNHQHQEHTTNPENEDSCHST